MGLVAIVNEVRAELTQIDNLILALDRLQAGRRRGRPPKLLRDLRSDEKAGMRTAAQNRRRNRKARKKASKRGLLP